jgi:acyl transferase domain-containing protein
MGKQLFENNQTFRDCMVWLDSIVWKFIENSVIETLYSNAHGKGDPFDRTLLTHPAIFMVEYSLAQTLMDAGILPDMVMGVSLGSFAAAAVAGFIEAEDALTAVIQQAMALEECCEPGGMTAILADPALFAEDFLGRHSELAAVNFSSHFVISARRGDLEGIEAALQKRNISYQRLPVSFPFHSRWIDDAKHSFQRFMRSIQCRQGRLRLACCEQMTVVEGVADGFFWNVVRQPIRFRETTARLEQEGPRSYIDLGPAGTLATFLKYLMPASTKSTVHAILTPYGLDQKNLIAVLASCTN